MKNIWASLALLGLLCSCQVNNNNVLQPPATAENIAENTEEIPSTGRVPVSQQSVYHRHGEYQFRLTLNEQGHGLLSTDGSDGSMQALKLHRVENFVVQEELLQYPEIAGRALAAHTVFLNQAGQGQVIAVNTASPYAPGGVYTGPVNLQPLDPITGEAMPEPEATPLPKAPLALRTVSIQRFNPATAFDTHTFEERFAQIQMGQVLTDEQGNGYLSLQVRDTLPQVQGEPSRLVFVPIQNHQVQRQLESLPVLAEISDQIVGAWLNAEHSGLFLVEHAARGGRWTLHTLQQGRLQPQSLVLDDTVSMGLPSIQLKANGKGSLFLRRRDGQVFYAPVQNFVPETPRLLPVRVQEHLLSSPDNTAVFAAFNDNQGLLVETPVQPQKPNTAGPWPFTLHRLALAPERLIETRTFAHDLSAEEFPGLGFGLSLTSRGDGLLGWSTARGRGDGWIHLRALDGFQVVP